MGSMSINLPSVSWSMRADLQDLGPLCTLDVVYAICDMVSGRRVTMTETTRATSTRTMEGAIASANRLSPLLVERYGDPPVSLA